MAGPMSPAQTTDPHEAPRPLGDPSEPALIVGYPAPAVLRSLRAEASVGRNELLRVGIVDGEISREHARIQRRNQTSTVVDLGSRNGTWLAGTRLKPGARTTLRDGDVLRIGRTLLVFREKLATDAAPASPLEIGERRFVGPWFVRALEQQLRALPARPPRHVLVCGPTGSGKELIARVLHDRLSARGAPWIATNVATLGAELAASQLFGHERGAFTGAVRPHDGLLRAAHGGTLFLDEIGDLPLVVQPMLLRFLQERVVTAVGGYREVPVDVRVIAAAREDLRKMVDEGRFRRDLYERLREAVIELPALRARPEDLWAIACEHVPELRGMEVEVEAMERLMVAELPGNVRQLVAEITAALREAPGALRVRAMGGGEDGARVRRPVTAAEAREVVRRFGSVAAAARGTGMAVTSLRRLVG